jgi:homoserine O-succinyltransferase
MTVHLSSGLPALDALAAESLSAAAGRPRAGEVLRLGLLNLMPDKVTTETQFARLAALSGLDVELVLLRPRSHRCKNAAPEHLERHYRTWTDIEDEGIDALVITGAPVETLDFEQVGYWPELAAILDDAAERDIPTYNVCWAGQAALYHFHGISKHLLGQKDFGVYEQSALVSDHWLFSGIAGKFPVPVSRHTDVCAAELARARGLRVLAASPESGLCIVEDPARRAVCVFNHFEYDAGTLVGEFERDRRAGRPVSPPANCHAMEPSSPPVWRDTAVRLFSNWLGSVRQ